VELVATVQVVHYWATEARPFRFFTNKPVTVAESSPEWLLKGNECVPVWENAWPLVAGAAPAFHVILQTCQYAVDDSGQPIGLPEELRTMGEVDLTSGTALAAMRKLAQPQPATTQEARHFKSWFSSPSVKVCEMADQERDCADGITLPRQRNSSWLRQNWSLLGTEGKVLKFCKELAQAQSVLPCAFLEADDGTETRTEVVTGRQVKGHLLPLFVCQKWAAMRGLDVCSGKVHLTWPDPSLFPEGALDLMPPVVVWTEVNTSHQLHAFAAVWEDKDFVLSE
jgi:hypothetical protein